mmetsp:Transcript_22778/g.49932  ORF Transcript_22778/g.49932 Transcript_22778/m.49932 type:complete len:226 (-) Transcript_22778:238-915(-)
MNDMGETKGIVDTAGDTTIGITAESGTIAREREAKARERGRVRARGTNGPGLTDRGMQGQRIDGGVVTRLTIGEAGQKPLSGLPLTTEQQQSLTLAGRSTSTKSRSGPWSPRVRIGVEVKAGEIGAVVMTRIMLPTVLAQRPELLSKLLRLGRSRLLQHRSTRRPRRLSSHSRMIGSPCPHSSSTKLSGLIWVQEWVPRRREGRNKWCCAVFFGLQFSSAPAWGE